MADMVPRRTLMKTALAVGALLLPSACTPNPRPGRLTVAGGESGGFYLEFATLLAGLLQREGVAEAAEPVVTGGSLENIRRLMSGEATFAVALADTAAVPEATPTAQPGGRLVALGKVYENYVHCIVRADSGITTFADLAGKTVGVGGIRLGHLIDRTANHRRSRAGAAPSATQPRPQPGPFRPAGPFH
ncbi:TAXI family TRAP transporter solute-binding subunit [Paenarthrobacter sp. S56]|uniref:TAXI family TRAP transporter solute-binding subunit n=1 Tax=Paenarthrobacter sp. S56 TaxID=3138179 RepID=UPI003219ED7F